MNRKKTKEEMLWENSFHDRRVREAKRFGEYPIIVAEEETLDELEEDIHELIARRIYFIVYKTARGLGLRRDFLRDEVDVEYRQFYKKFTKTPTWGARILERSSSGINCTGNYSEYKEGLDNILSGKPNAPGKSG